MKNKRKIFITLAAIAFTLFILLPAIAFSILNWAILPPHKLTPLVTGEVNKRINGELSCEKIELTFFSTYPHLGLRISNGQIISHSIPDSIRAAGSYESAIDSLLLFKALTLSLQPIDYLTKRIITIGEVALEEPHIHGYVNENGLSNWNIYTDTSQEDIVSEEDSVSAIPPIDLQKVRIQDAHFIYNDRQAGIYTEIEDFFLLLKGSLTGGGNTLAVETGSSSILFESPAYTLNNHLALRFKSNIELFDDYHTLVLQQSELLVNKIPFTADGSFTYLPENKTLGINVEMGLQASDLNDLISFIPEAYFTNRKDLKATGSILVHANMYGELGEQSSPTLNLSCKLENGSFFMKDVKQGIEALEMDLDLHLNGPEPGQSFVTLEKLKMTGLNTTLDAKAKVTDLLQSPAIDTYIKGKIDFTRLAEEFLNPDTILLYGNMDADIQTSFRLDDLMQGKYNNIRALGSLSIDSLKAGSRPFDIDLFIANAQLNVDSTKSSSAYIAGDDLLNVALSVDSMNISYKDEIDTNLRKLSITAKTSPLVDTTAVVPITSHIRIERLRTRLPDSVWVVARNAYLRGGIKPSESNKQIPQLLAGITVDSLRYFNIPSRMGAILSNSTISIEALPYRDAVRQRFQTVQKDSTRQFAQRDSTRRRTTARSSRNQQPDSTSSSIPFLRNWEARGSISFNDMRLFSRAFPLPMRMEKTKVRFDTNTITFADALFHAGKSNFTLNGDIRNIRRAMLRGGKLQGQFSIASDFIDCNQLIQAINQGMLFMDQTSAKDQPADETALMEADTAVLQETIAINDTDTTEQLFMVPAFLDMSLQVEANHLDYKDLKMTNVSGEIVMRDQSINLKKLEMQSNLGNGNLNMFYNTSGNNNQASVGFDLDMQEILVDKLLDLYPAIDTLLPMLRSFEGIVDCQMAATCDVDSLSSVILPSLNTGCHIEGKNMVLLDGETFAEISKTLMFKNKKKNLIDSISVDLSIKDSKIDVYPFLVEIDRYRVAVGGTHNLDMTFDYHVSVLKSPVPFKLGIDITGSLDKYKFKITKCRYKDIFKPVKEQVLEDIPGTLREEIRAYIRKQIIQNAPELAINKAPEPKQNEE